LSKLRPARATWLGRLAQTESDLPPNPAEFEVSLFGPGRGEAIAVHLGQQRWMLVDSCVDVNRQPASLTYLDSLGISPDQVDLVVATHWHDDHIGGLGEVVRACEAAEFAYSGALSTEEFFALVGALSERAQIRRSGVSEFADVVQTLQERKVTPKLALEGRLLWSRGGSDAPGFVRALSPSDSSISLSQQALGELLPTPQTGKRAVLAPRPNHASVVLWVEIGGIPALLGADLEETINAGTGWPAVLDAFEPDSREASVFKVPHHGSGNGDQPRVWQELLEEEPFAVLTPFVRGAHRLPREVDSRRLLERSSKAFISAPPERRVRGRSPAVEATLAEFGLRPVAVDPEMGQVRLRRKYKEEDWRIELFGPAMNLADLVSET
jgi:beta-lactamase superfamily II metal-dependent hydrolase